MVGNVETNLYFVITFVYPYGFCFRIPLSVFSKILRTNLPTVRISLTIILFETIDSARCLRFRSRLLIALEQNPFDDRVEFGNRVVRV